MIFFPFVYFQGGVDRKVKSRCSTDFDWKKRFIRCITIHHSRYYQSTAYYRPFSHITSNLKPLRSNVFSRSITLKDNLWITFIVVRKTEKEEWLYSKKQCFSPILKSQVPRMPHQCLFEVEKYEYERWEYFSQLFAFATTWVEYNSSWTQVL